MKQLKSVKLLNNYSNKVFEYTNEDFMRFFHDTILTICFKLKNQGIFIPEPGKTEEPPIDLVLKHWEELAICYNSAFEKPNYSVIEFK